MAEFETDLDSGLYSGNLMIWTITGSGLDIGFYIFIYNFFSLLLGK